MNLDEFIQWFRVFDIKNKIYTNLNVETYEGVGTDNIGININSKTIGFDYDFISIENYKVEFYTGLTDLKGKPVFQGDIVEWGNNKVGFSKEIGLTKWCEDSYKNIMQIYNRETKEIIDSVDFLQVNLHFTVIGNINQNPEFLTKKD